MLNRNLIAQLRSSLSERPLIFILFYYQFRCWLVNVVQLQRYETALWWCHEKDHLDFESGQERKNEIMCYDDEVQKCPLITQNAKTFFLLLPCTYLLLRARLLHSDWPGMGLAVLPWPAVCIYIYIRSRQHGQSHPGPSKLPLPAAFQYEMKSDGDLE